MARPISPTLATRRSLCSWIAFAEEPNESNNSELCSMRELQSPSRGSRVFLPYLILLLGFCFTLLVYHYFSKLTYEQDRMRFDRAVQQIEDRLHTRIETSTTLLRAATGLFAASDVVQA